MWPIKWNGITKCSKMVANILPVDPPLTLVSKGQNSFFQNMVMLHIKFIGITKCSNMVANIFCPQTPLILKVKRSKFNFFRTMSRYISIKGNHECSNIVPRVSYVLHWLLLGKHGKYSCLLSLIESAVRSIIKAFCWLYDAFPWPYEQTFSGGWTRALVPSCLS